MIRSFRHKGLKRLFETGERRGVAPQLAARLRRQLDVLNQARTTADMNLPAYRLHQLKRNRSGTPGVLAVAETGVSRSDLKVKTLSMLTLKIIIKHSKYGEHLAK